MRRVFSSLEPQDMDPSWSPDSAQVAFVCYRRQRVETRFGYQYLGPYDGLQGHKLKEICVSDLGGSNRRQLTDNMKAENAPSWSPDGTQIAFVSARDVLKGTNIYVMQKDGTNQVRLTHHAAGYSRPRWSPDGNIIAFIQNSAAGDSLYTVAADGSWSARLTPPGWDGRISDFDWSPDGKHIVFSSGNVAFSSEVYTIGIGNGSITRLTNNQAYDSGPTWAPDSRHVAFMSNRQGDLQVYVMDVQTLEQTKISESAVGAMWGVSWSPDGQLLSFVSMQGYDEILHVLNLETGISRTFPNFEALGRPLWSPNSQYLIYERTEDWNEDGFGEVKIWVLRVDDGVEWAVSSTKQY